jgi:hypothetical protein
LGIGSSGLLNNPLSGGVIDDLRVGFGREAVALDTLSPDDGGLFGFDYMAQDGLLLDNPSGHGEPLVQEIGGRISEDTVLEADAPVVTAEKGQEQRPQQACLAGEAGWDWDYYYSFMEEYLFIREHEFWKEDAELNKMLDEMEETIEGSEERPFCPGELEESHPQSIFQRNARPAVSPSPGRRATGKSGGRPWVELRPWLWRPRGPKKPRPQKLGPWTPKTRRQRSRTTQIFTDCPVARQVVTDDECKECEYRNVQKWLENPGEEDRCTHPEYWAYKFEVMFGQRDSEGDE